MKSLITVLTPEEVRLALANYCLEKRGCDYKGPAKIELMTCYNQSLPTHVVIQYRVEIEFKEAE